MSAPSAYPRPLAEVVAAGRALVAELGRTPSQREVRKHLRVGAPRAREVLAQLDETAAADLVATVPPDGPEPATMGQTTTVGPTCVGQTTTQVTPAVEPAENVARRVASWPLVLLALPAFVAIWSGWTGLGGMTGFGPVHPLPGIADGFTINSAITLPIGVESYAAYALRVWLGAGTGDRARRFARVSAIASLITGALGQVGYHLLTAAGATRAPWPITALVACLPIATLGMGAALAHLVRAGESR
ncbi:ABC transporter permease [Actinocatenispora comari]|uniref:ABC transporter permease n=1 Tax=Actinocatenispora comari TaxID=2807577 RepID=A0A8J4AI31_9ACTN|nr:ABC transporter permease [Actinocatenispora comari]GIL29945.1 ABC transporter permease [Actinocatenispora comari]